MIAFDFLFRMRNFCQNGDGIVALRSLQPTPESLIAFWEKRQGKFAEVARFLTSLPVTSAEVERSFSLADCVDTSVRHALLDEHIP